MVSVHGVQLSSKRALPVAELDAGPWALGASLRYKPAALFYKCEKEVFDFFNELNSRDFLYEEGT